MIIEVVPKDGRRGLFTLMVDQEPWREIHRTIFGKKPSFPKNIQNITEFEAAFAAAEHAGARRYAVWRLSRFSQSAHTLTSALERLLVSEECRQRVIQELIAAGFLNDEEYSKRLVASECARGRGPAAARAKLHRKGIDEDLAAEALQEMDDDTQRASIQRLMTTRYARRNLTDYKERQKVIASLIRRGFSLEHCKVIIDQFLALKSSRG